MVVAQQVYQKAELVERKDYAEDLWSIRIRPEEPLVFRPGQYATLGMWEGGKVVERPYSIVSSPLEEEVEFFFELVPHGGLTPRMHEAKVGETVVMRRQAKGLFTFDDKSGNAQHFMLGTVTGVAPYVSMVRTLAREPSNTRPPGFRVVLVHSASRSWEFAYREEVEKIAGKSNWLTYIPTVSRPWEDPSWNGEVGRAEDVLRKYLDDLKLEPSNTTAYLCGHPQMIVNAQGILERRGFKKEHVRQELYWVPKKEAK
ncbi:MAG: ferredoxin--NADP reductase [Acidobacteria bacterium]|nr:ferredoxin--NADP reductase [Acidobacteriota bacterium]